MGKQGLLSVQGFAEGLRSILSSPQGDAQGSRGEHCPGPKRASSPPALQYSSQKWTEGAQDSGDQVNGTASPSSEAPWLCGQTLSNSWLPQAVQLEATQMLTVTKYLYMSDLNYCARIPPGNPCSTGCSGWSSGPLTGSRPDLDKWSCSTIYRAITACLASRGHPGKGGGGVGHSHISGQLLSYPEGSLADVQLWALPLPTQRSLVPPELGALGQKYLS